MKLRWMTGILMAGVLAIPAIAQADHPQPPGISETPTEPSNDSAVSPNSTPQPQNNLTAYEQQMALVTAQTYKELAQIAEAVESGQITSEHADYLARRSFEVGMVQLQFLDTLHQIVETALSKEGPSLKPEDQPSQVTTSEQTLVVAPPTSSPNIPESVAKYLELTPAQIAAIQSRVTQEQNEVHPLLQHLSENRKALTIAVHAKPFSNTHIRRLAVEQSHILQQLILANSHLERDIYQILTVEQRQKLNAAEARLSDITQQPLAEQ